METNVLSIAAQFPETKTEIKLFAEKMIESVLDGYSDPMKVKVQLTAMKKTIEEIEANEEFKECVLSDAAKYHKDELKNLHNANIQIKETGVKYDYSQCGMPEYDLVCSEIERLNERKKALETRLKTVVAGEQYIDPLTSEMVELFPPSKSSTTTLTITLNK